MLIDIERKLNGPNPGPAFAWMIFTALARRAAGIVSRTMAPTLRARRPASTNVASAQEKPIAEKKTGRKRRIKVRARVCPGDGKKGHLSSQLLAINSKPTPLLLQATEASADEDLPKEKAVRASKSRKSAELSKKEGPTWAMQIRLAAKVTPASP